MPLPHYPEKGAPVPPLIIHVKCLPNKKGDRCKLLPRFSQGWAHDLQASLKVVTQKGEDTIENMLKNVIKFQDNPITHL